MQADALASQNMSRSPAPRRRATLASLAAELKVSRTTISNAYNRPDQLSADLRERVLAAAKQLGYPGPDPVARSLRTRRAGAVGLVITEPLTYAFSDPAALNFVAGERQIQRKLEHLYTADDPQFRRELGVLLGPPVIDGNRIGNLENGIEIFPAMLAAVRGARHNINFETYIYWSGEIGKKFADALSERAKASVGIEKTSTMASGKRGSTPRRC